MSKSIIFDYSHFVHTVGIGRLRITGISDVAFVVFVRKHQPEIQYLKASISEDQRWEFGRLVETTKQRLAKSKRGSLRHTVEFVSPKTVALAAAIWGSALTTSNWSM